MKLANPGILYIPGPGVEVLRSLKLLFCLVANASFGLGRDRAEAGRLGRARAAPRAVFALPGRFTGALVGRGLGSMRKTTTTATATATTTTRTTTTGLAEVWPQ